MCGFLTSRLRSIHSHRRLTLLWKCSHRRVENFMRTFYGTNFTINLYAADSTARIKPNKIVEKSNELVN